MNKYSPEIQVALIPVPGCGAPAVAKRNGA